MQPTSQLAVGFPVPAAALALFLPCGKPPTRTLVGKAGRAFEPGEPGGRSDENGVGSPGHAPGQRLTAHVGVVPAIAVSVPVQFPNRSSPTTVCKYSRSWETAQAGEHRRRRADDRNKPGRKQRLPEIVKCFDSVANEYLLNNWGRLGEYHHRL